jgi:hypothetical protein
LTHCQLRAALAISAGRPFIYGLLAATDPVRLFPSSVFRTSSFPHFHIISFTVPYRRLYLCNPTPPLTDIIIQSFIHALQALRHPDSETETQLCRSSGCLSTIVEYRLRPRSTTVKLSITTMYHRNACEGVRVPPHQIAT